MTTKERRIGEWLLEKKEEIKGEREVSQLKYSHCEYIVLLARLFSHSPRILLDHFHFMQLYLLLRYNKHINIVLFTLIAFTGQL